MEEHLAAELGKTHRARGPGAPYGKKKGKNKQPKTKT
jgi:hypothetical protein